MHCKSFILYLYSTFNATAVAQSASQSLIYVQYISTSSLSYRNDKQE